MAKWPRDLWMAAAFDDPTLSPNHRAVMYAYAQYAKDQDITWCPYDELLRRTGIRSKSTVARTLEDLQSRGWLAEAQAGRGRRATRYRLTLPPSSTPDVPLQPVDNSSSGTAGGPLQPVDNPEIEIGSSTPDARSSTPAARSGTAGGLDHSDHSDKSTARASRSSGSSAPPGNPGSASTEIEQIADRVGWPPTRVADALASRKHGGVRNPAAYARKIADVAELTRWLRGGEPTPIPDPWQPPEPTASTPDGRAQARAIWQQRHYQPEPDDLLELVYGHHELERTSSP